MKLALIVALAADRRSGRVISGLIPRDQAVRSIRDITEDTAGGPIIQVWSANAVKEKAFRGVTLASDEETVAPGDELNALLAANSLLEEQGKRDEERIKSLLIELEASEKSVSARNATIDELSGVVATREARLTELEALLKAAAQDLESREETINSLSGFLAAKTTLAETLHTQLDEVNARLAQALSAPPASTDQNTPPTALGESATSPAASSDAAAGGDQLPLAQSSATTESSAGAKKKGK